MDSEVYTNGMYRQSRNYSGNTVNSPTMRNKTRSLGLWRPRSLVNLVSPRSHRVLHSASSVDDISNILTHGSDGSLSVFTNKDKSATKKTARKGWNTIVTVVVVEAKDLPDLPSDGSEHHAISCKIRLGSETAKSKSVPSSHHPKWRERLKLHLNKDHMLKVSLWDKGKQRNCMGSCVIDLSKLEKERTHEIWHELDDNFGSIHLNVTMCTVRHNTATSDNIYSLGDARERFAFYNLKSDWKVVGQLHVKLVGAKGLSGRPNAYCTLEVDNEMVQTPNARTTTEPEWNKSYIFNVYDVTATLDLKVYDNSLVNALRTESLGKVSIPLLRIRNEELRWYALKDKNKRNCAKGNSPRVLLQMSLIWNPVTATLRLFRPKEVKYIKKPPKFDLALVLSNLEFVRDTFNVLYEINEIFKRFLEWESKEMSSVALLLWLVFWYYFRPWIAPLLLLVPFVICFYFYRTGDERHSTTVHTNDDETGKNEGDKGEKTGKVQRTMSPISGLQDTTLTITHGVEYLASLTERLYNLVTFKVSFLSYLVMMFLVQASIVLYYIPVNYLLMGLGVYKYTRKILNPHRKLNNDLLDFISRIPDNELLKDWKELSVPEPHGRNTPHALVRSHSNSL